MNIICGIKNNETLDGVTQAQVMEMNKLNDSQCKRPCPGNPNQICGGDQDPNSGTSGKISVYQLGDESKYYSGFHSSIPTMTIDQRNKRFCLICFHTIEVREWVLGKPPSDPMKVSNPNGADGEWSNENHVKFLTTEPEIAGDDKSRRYCVSDAIVNGGRFKVRCVQIIIYSHCHYVAFVNLQEYIKNQKDIESDQDGLVTNEWKTSEAIDVEVLAKRCGLYHRESESQIISEGNLPWTVQIEVKDFNK